jgi:RNA polymerase sigma-70 factor (ECF subfamily)
MPVTHPEELFFSLLKPEQGKLYRTAWAILGNEADASDALQEAVIRAHRNFSQLKGGAVAFPYWIRRIVVNQCSQILRKRKRVIPVERPEELREDVVAPPPEGPGSDVWEAVQKLDERHRAVVVLRFAEDKSLEDIAKALDIPLGTVKSRLHTALKQLRAHLTESEAERRGAV